MPKAELRAIQSIDRHLARFGTGPARAQIKEYLGEFLAGRAPDRWVQ